MNFFSKNGLTHEKLIWGLAMDEQQPLCSLVLVRKKGKKLQAVDTFETKELAEALDLLQKSPGIPVAVSLRLEGLSEGLIPEDSLEAVSQVLGVSVRQPNRFVVQHLPGDAGYQWSSVVSRKSLEAWLEKLASLDHRLIHISLSPIAQAWLLPALEAFEPAEAYQWSPGVCWQAGSIGLGAGMEIEDREKKLGQALRVPPGHVAAYAAVLHSELQLASSIPLVKKSRLSIEMELNGMRKSWQAFLFGLIACLIMAYGRHYFQQEVADLNELLAKFDKEMGLVEARHEQLTRELKFLESQGGENLQGSQLSYFLDQVFSLTPLGLHFQSLSFFPEDKERDELDPEADMILKGQALAADELARFTQKLDSLDFLQDVALQESAFSPETSSYTFCLTARLALP